MLQYTDGGLRNVWLASGYEVRQTRHGKAVLIRNQEGLTKAICLALTGKTGHLTGVEFRYIRSAGMLSSQSALAQLIGVDAQTVARWEKSGKVPRWADKFMRLLYAAHAEGNQTVRKVVERVNLVERLVHQRIVVQELRCKRLPPKKIVGIFVGTFWWSKYLSVKNQWVNLAFGTQYRHQIAIRQRPVPSENPRAYWHCGFFVVRHA